MATLLLHLWSDLSYRAKFPFFNPALSSVRRRTDSSRGELVLFRVLLSSVRIREPDVQVQV